MTNGTGFAFASNRFFQLMGSVFSFVSSDLKAKIETLESLRRQENELQEEFETFGAMIEYEKANNLLSKRDYVSGSRTLLRLHRGLGKQSALTKESKVTEIDLLAAFIREFMHRISQLEPSEKTCYVCQSAYNDTLAQYHPWLVRKGAVVAMYAMPTREQLLNKVCIDAEKAIVALPNVLESAKIVYERTEKLYTEHDLHTLP